MAENDFQFGKKVFFLNPPAILSDLAEVLSTQEYEVYLVYNHERLARYLRKEPNAIVFVNIDTGISEPEWGAWIRAIHTDIAAVGVGVITMLVDPHISRKYIIDIGITCGFIVINIGATKTVETLLKTLEAREARGRRKYIRAACPRGTAECTVTSRDSILRGTVQDLSVVGMAAWFDTAEELPVGFRLKDCQLTLRGARIFLNGIIIGRRLDEEGAAVYVVMFEPGSLSDEKREKIRSYMRRVLQDELNRQLDSA